MKQRLDIKERLLSEAQQDLSHLRRMQKTQQEEIYDQRLKSFESIMKDKDDEIAHLLDE